MVEPLWWHKTSRMKNHHAARCSLAAMGCDQFVERGLDFNDHLNSAKAQRPNLPRLFTPGTAPYSVLILALAGRRPHRHGLGRRTTPRAKSRYQCLRRPCRLGRVQAAARQRQSATPPRPTGPAFRHPFHCVFTNFLTSPRKSAPYTLPSASAVTPSAMLEPPGYGYGHASGMKYLTEPSAALPMRMPRCAPKL